MYILNEKEYIRDILASGRKPEDLSVAHFISLTARYYCSDSQDAGELSDLIKKKLAEFDLDNYQEYRYHNKIIGICEGLYSGSIKPELKEREYIPIYESELNLIKALPDDRQKKLMFTLYAIARYMDCEGWINKKSARDLSEVFKLANITLPSDKRNELLHALYVNGYIFAGKRVDNLNIRVRLAEPGEVGYQLKEFRNIGYQYLGNFKKGYKQCICCGKSYKTASPKDYSSKYCSRCAYEIKLKQVNECRKRRNGIKAIV